MPFRPERLRATWLAVVVSLWAWLATSVLALVAVSCAFAFLAEWAMIPAKNGKISQAVWVTAALFGLSLPPTAPFWIAAVGVVFGIVFGKMVFGGFGKNVFNPAVVGRAFVYGLAHWVRPA